MGRGGASTAPRHRRIPNLTSALPLPTPPGRSACWWLGGLLACRHRWWMDRSLDTHTGADCEASGAGSAAMWMRASLDASGDGYMVWRAVREVDGEIVDWVVVDANAPARLGWRA